MTREELLKFVKHKIKILALEIIERESRQNRCSQGELDLYISLESILEHAHSQDPKKQIGIRTNGFFAALDELLIKMGYLKKDQSFLDVLE